jgi:OmpA-OmpF porin, OOP family
MKKGVCVVKSHRSWLVGFIGLLGCVLPSLVSAAGTYELKGNTLLLPAPIQFETAGDALRPESEALLQQVANYLKEKSFISLLRIEGHTDNQGDPGKNQTLSEKRALSVGRWLIAHGVDCHRLLAVGFGGSKPAAENSTPEGRAQNRRILFVNAALRGRPIGGMPVDGGGHVAGELCK